MSRNKAQNLQRLFSLFVCIFVGISMCIFVAKVFYE